MRRTALSAALLLGTLLTTAAAAPVPIAAAAPVSDIPTIVDRLVVQPRVGDVALSPDGAHLALQMAQDDKTIIVVLRRSDGGIAAHMGFGEDTHIVDPVWVSPHVVLARLLKRVDKHEAPLGTGIVYRLDLRDGKAAALNSQVSGVVRGAGDQGIGVGAELLDGLANDDDHVLLHLQAFEGLAPIPEVHRSNLATGRMRLVARSPVANAGFITDAKGQVRIAQGSPANDVFETWYRESDDAEWQRLHRAERDDVAWYALGFSEDGQRILFQKQQAKGPSRLEWRRVDSGEWSVAWSHPVFDPGVIQWSGIGVPIGVRAAGGERTTTFFDAADPVASVHRDLAKLLAGKAIHVGRPAGPDGVRLVTSYSDRDPGSFHLWNPTTRQLERIAALLDGVEASTLAPSVPFSFKARDGLELHGLLTRPIGASAGPVPMVLMPHGGPIGVHDDGSFDETVQLLAQAGYGVLQVNFRGSSSRGGDFLDAGRGQWGAAMQRDLEDAIAWANAEGHATAGRWCAVGASYGAYASMLALANDPAMFACGVGEVGLYDLTTWEESADVGRFRRAREAVGNSIGDVDRSAISPIRRVAQIKDPVLLHAGALDQRTPPAQTTAFAAALREAGVAVDVKVYEGEGHGLYALKNRRDRALRLLGFLRQHLPPGG
jgi:dienelactone hydrolase